LVPALQGSNTALISFGDFPMADALSPAVTVVDQDPVTLAPTDPRSPRASGRRFRRRMVHSMNLIERESCLLVNGALSVPSALP
jgi:LacI family transcriptional regulator